MDYSKHDYTEPYQRNEMDIKFQIHCLEKEAYGSVLRAFIAQSNLLSWGKEGLITELRKELNITDSEHGELLVKINSDESIKMMRESRKGAPHCQDSIVSNIYTPGPARNSLSNDPHKIRKRFRPPVSKSQMHNSNARNSSAALPSLVPAHLTGDQRGGELVMFPSGNSGRSLQVVGHDSQAPLNSKERGPAKSLYKYQGSHGVDQAEYRDDQHGGKLVISSSGNSGRSLQVLNHGLQAPLHGKERGPAKSQSVMASHTLHLGNSKKIPDFIEIRATDKLIHEVERMMYVKGSDPAEVEKAKLILREHEDSIIEALAKLSDVPDNDDSPHRMQHHYPHGELHGTIQRKVKGDGDFHGQAGRLHGYPPGTSVQTLSMRKKSPHH